jgi:hypothetical protein
MYHVYTDNWPITTNWLWQMTDPPSRQRGHPIWTGQWLTKKKKYLVMSPRRARHRDGLTDWLTDRQLQCDCDSLTLAATAAVMLMSRQQHGSESTPQRSPTFIRLVIAARVHPAANAEKNGWLPVTAHWSQPAMAGVRRHLSDGPCIGIMALFRAPQRLTGYCTLVLRSMTLFRATASHW